MAERKGTAASAQPSRPPRVVVTLRRSGGFAGMTRSWTADSAALGHDDAERLVALASAADLRPTAGAGPQPDAFSYELTVKVGRSAAQRLRFSDAEAGEDVRALIAHVRACGSA